MFSPISRRAFLKRSGAFVALLGSLSNTGVITQGRAAILGTSLGLANLPDIVGRPFSITPVYPAPDPAGTITGKLMPDQPTPIVSLSDDGWWYEVPKGFVPRETLQPIHPYQTPTATRDLGFYEVIAPMSIVRDCCASHGQIVARLAFGSLAYVHDHLMDDRNQLWYAVSGTPSGSGLFGWAQAATLRRWTANVKTRLTEPSIWIDSQRYKLTLYDGEQCVGETAIHSGPLLLGMGRLAANTPSIWYDVPPYAYSWNMLLHRDFGKPTHLRAATWHNRFGVPGEQQQFIDLPLFAARWLFNVLAYSPRAGIPVVIE